MSNKSIYKILFLTLTFAPTRPGIDLDNINVNALFSRFMENLTKTYGVGWYIAVKQWGDLHGRVHFHLVVSMPFIDFRILNDYWCSVISEFCEYSANALSSDKKTRILYKPMQAVRHICQYLSKARKEINKHPSNTRIIFTSHFEDPIRKDISNYEISQLTKGYTTEIIKLNDYCIMYKVRGYSDRFIKNVVFSFLPQKIPASFEFQYADIYSAVE